jgi:hypothetical protein
LSEEQKRWVVWNPKTGRYVAGKSRSVSWTYDRQEAQDIAAGLPGFEVTDLEAFMEKAIALLESVTS